jgi:zinc D-Ala-D-Ala dipeptidase
VQNLKSRKILGYEDLAACAPGESTEPLVDIRKYDAQIQAQHVKKDMLPYVGDVMMVRDEVAKKVARVNEALMQEGLRVKVVYGYRHPDIQNKYFNRRRNELKTEFPNLSSNELDRLTHDFVAIPEVAGHPTGGAVDLVPVDEKGKVLDMGTKIADYTDTDAIRTFSKRVSPDQRQNRMVLHDLMIREGFAPFYGEWWHFSFGDREWAAFYGKKKALYGPIKLDKKS